MSRSEASRPQWLLRNQWGQVQGPLSKVELDRLVVCGQVDKTYQVRRVSQQAWLPLAELFPELRTDSALQVDDLLQLRRQILGTAQAGPFDHLRPSSPEGQHLSEEDLPRLNQQVYQLLKSWSRWTAVTAVTMIAVFLLPLVWVPFGFSWTLLPALLLLPMVLGVGMHLGGIASRVRGFLCTGDAPYLVEAFQLHRRAWQAATWACGLLLLVLLPLLLANMTIQSPVRVP